jgi:hypothetical protein
MALALVFLAAPSKPVGNGLVGQSDCRALVPAEAETPLQPLLVQHTDSHSVSPNPAETNTQADVYVAGYERGYGSDILIVTGGRQRISVAKVWKNGKDFYWLTNRKTSSSALSLNVSGDDVYVGDFGGRAWKNGKPFLEHYMYVTSVFASSDDVYCLAGDALVYKNGSPLYSHPALAGVGLNSDLRPDMTRQDIFTGIWDPLILGHFESYQANIGKDSTRNIEFIRKNSYFDLDKQRLYDKGFSPNTSLAVSDGNVYVAGSYRDKALDKRMAKVWKNGEELHCLTDGQLNAYASSIAVSGGDVYVAGTVFDTQKTSAAKVWKNGEELYSFASELKGRAYGDCIFVTGTDVYVAGTDFDKSSRKKIAKAWKNGEEIFSLKDSIINSLYVFGEDVYVAGCRQKGGGTKTAKAWKNGKELYTLTDGKDNADAYAIFVK